MLWELPGGSLGEGGNCVRFLLCGHGELRKERLYEYFEETEPELTDEQVARIDEIHNAVYELCKVLTEDPELEWDMQYIGEIADCAAETMCKVGYKVRYPAIVSEEDGPDRIEEYYG